MLRHGTKVAELTKRAGQSPRRGTVVDLRKDDVEVRWEDGHVSVISRTALRPVKNNK